MFWLAPVISPSTAQVSLVSAATSMKESRKASYFMWPRLFFVFDPGRFSHTVDDFGGPDPGKFTVTLELYLADFP